VVSATIRAGVLNDCAPSPRCMPGINNFRLSGWALPDSPWGRDWAAVASVVAWASGRGRLFGGGGTQYLMYFNNLKNKKLAGVPRGFYFSLWSFAKNGQ
jgi:hypothetical protein